MIKILICIVVFIISLAFAGIIKFIDTVNEIEKKEQENY